VTTPSSRRTSPETNTNTSRLAGIITGHFRGRIVPRASELSLRLIVQDLIRHLRLRIRAATGGPRYGLLQKCAYRGVVFVALPLVAAVATGLAMSPAMSAANPFLSRIFGGSQSARTRPGWATRA
jgi:thiosulfate reductase cytochrome b subunit